MKKTVCFLGNCQAQALEALVAHLQGEVNVVRLPPNFMLSEIDQDHVVGVFDRCDYIFHQRVAAEYPVDFVRGDWIKQHYGKKSISWPNIYFDGYFPGLRYLYDNHGQKIVGPIGDYHFPEVMHGWKNSLSAEQVANYFQYSEPLQGWEAPPTPVEESLSQLSLREQDVDCSISDFISERFQSTRLFYTMNHPTNEVLGEMLYRLFKYSGLPVFTRENLQTFPYTLNEIIIPISSHFVTRYRPKFDEDYKIKTFTLDDARNKNAQSMNWQEISLKFYEIYNDSKYLTF
jgi:curved DNA-binding protein CbpA